MVGIDERESLPETLFWLSQPGTLESIAEATADLSERLGVESAPGGGGQGRLDVLRIWLD
jgi:hypothetical protein